MSMPLTGVIIGTFCPPHKGHEQFIQKASEHVENLHVICCYRRNELPTGKIRMDWINEMFPNVTCHLLFDDDYDTENVSQWEKLVEEKLGFTPDVLITSNLYSMSFAQTMSYKNITINHEHDMVQISEKRVLNNPLKHWDMLGTPLKRHYAIRVVLVGPESGGKTTLCQRLIKRYETTWVDEMVRVYAEEKASQGHYLWFPKDFDNLAKQQIINENKAAEESNRIAICDNDSFASYVWHSRYMWDEREELLEIANNCKKPDLYLLCDHNVPFVQDGVRDGEQIREKMFNTFKRLLLIRGANFKILGGSYDDRYAGACEAIENICNEKGYEPIIYSNE